MLIYEKTILIPWRQIEQVTLPVKATHVINVVRLANRKYGAMMFLTRLKGNAKLKLCYAVSFMQETSWTRFMLSVKKYATGSDCPASGSSSIRMKSVVPGLRLRTKLNRISS